MKGAANKGGVWRAVRLVVASPVLRNVVLAEAAVSATATITLVALTVFAFDVGGASLLGVALALRFLGVGALRPVVGVLLDRRSAQSGLRIGCAWGVAGTVLCVVGGVVGGAFGVVAVIGGVCLLKLGHSIAKSGRRAAIATASDGPQQATATIGLLSMVNSSSALAGPLIAAGALVVVGVSGALAVGAVLYAVGALLMWNLPLSSEPAIPDGSVRQVLSGQRETLRAPVVVLTFALTGTASFMSGAVAVFYAPLAIEALSSGDAGVGIMRTAFGFGALMLSMVVLRRFSAGASDVQLAAGVLLWGVMMLPLALAGNLAFALAPIVGMGAGRTLVDTAYLSLVQHAVPESLHPRVLGLGETINFLAGGLGSLAAAPLIGAVDLSAAITFIGLIGIAVGVGAGLLLRRQRHEHHTSDEVAQLVAETPTLALLPAIERDLLAVRVGRRPLRAGETLMRQGADGDSWFLVVSGVLDVRVGDHEVSSLVRGDGVGEIALIRSCPRTATVTARTDADVLELGRTTFLRAVGLADPTDLHQLVETRLAEH